LGRTEKGDEIRFVCEKGKRNYRGGRRGATKMSLMSREINTRRKER